MDVTVPVVPMASKVTMPSEMAVAVASEVAVTVTVPVPPG